MADVSVTLPKPLIRGNTSARCISDLMRPRSPDYEHMFHAGQEQLGHYYLAPFQRTPVWSDEQSARLIESVHLGISIGSFVVSGTAKHNPKTNMYQYTSDWIIDGQQRMRALRKYLDDELAVFVGTPHEHHWSQLSTPQQRGFELVPVGFIELTTDNEDELRDIYDRLNFGGVAHTEDQRACR